MKASMNGNNLFIKEGSILRLGRVGGGGFGFSGLVGGVVGDVGGWNGGWGAIRLKVAVRVMFCFRYAWTGLLNP